MKVLLINDKSSEGGAEVQHWREYELLNSKGHEAFSLTFDENMERSGSPCFNIPIGGNVVQKFLIRASSRSYRPAIHSVISSVRPDVIHIGNAIKSPLALYKEVESYPCVQTIRDYGIICPKSTCILSDYSICDGYKFNDCKKCNMGTVETAKSCLLPRVNQARLAAVDVLVAPSQALADACSRNGFETLCLNNPFDFKLIEDEGVACSSKSYLYYGVISEAKGVGQLAEAFRRFSAGKPDVSLSFAGRVENKFADAFQNILKRYGFNYLGVLSNHDVLEHLKSTYCVVVPSLWIENYPNTVLEPLASRILVIGSNRGGIPELIQNDKLVFDVTNVRSIVETLDYTYTITPQMYSQIAISSSERVRRENNLELFYQKLLNVFSLAIKRHKLRI